MITRVTETDWRRRVDELPRPWKQVVAKCLEPDQARRFRSAQLAAEALEPRRTTLRWGAIAAIIAAGIGYWQWQQPPSGPAVRLAILPFRIEPDTAAGAAAVAQDVAGRLSGARRNFWVVGPLEAKQNQVDSPETAKRILGATHVLQTRLSGTSGRIAAEAQLVDLESGNTVRALKSDYAAGDTTALAKALIGTVTVGLKLKSRSPREPVSAAAYPAYVQGQNTLAQDPRKAGEAITLLERAIALDPRSAAPYAELARAELQRYRNGDGRQWLDAAAEAAGKAAGINPDSVQVLFAAGQVDQFRGRYEEAITAFNRAGALDPGNQAIWRLLAETYQLAGRDEDSVRTYRKGIEAEPRGYLPYMNFGNYYLSHGQYRQAEEMYRQITVFAPGLASGHMNLGLALKQQGRYAEAEQSLLKAKSLRSSPRLLLNLGALYYEQERYDDAVQLFQESAKTGAASAILHRNLADALRHLSRNREAAVEYREARARTEDEVTLNPRSAEARARLALLSARLGDTHRASYELSQALAMAGGSSVPVIPNAAETYEVLQQRSRAIELLQRAPRSLLEELGRVPDLVELRQDPRFQQLLQKP
jgi:tetratricopeptide (TPR) repeat protein